MSFYQRTVISTTPEATLLIRLLVGVVFPSEGIQKFLFPASLGAGRFLKIGMPAPLDGDYSTATGDLGCDCRDKAANVTCG